MPETWLQVSPFSDRARILPHSHTLFGPSPLTKGRNAKWPLLASVQETGEVTHGKPGRAQRNGAGSTMQIPIFRKEPV